MPASTEPKMQPKAKLGIGIAFAILILAFVVGYIFNTTTELTPDHADLYDLTFSLACLAGLIGAITGYRLHANLQPSRRLSGAGIMALTGAAGIFLLSGTIINIATGITDFPPEKTRTFTTDVEISRAYQTHGRGESSWNIQTTPYWSNIDITKSDYRFMQQHRRPGDAGQDPDEISSLGYFCARVTMQQAGEALRILHAGSRKLPKGTIHICPDADKIFPPATSAPPPRTAE